MSDEIIRAVFYCDDRASRMGKDINQKDESQTPSFNGFTFLLAAGFP